MNNGLGEIFFFEISSRLYSISLCLFIYISCKSLKLITSSNVWNRVVMISLK